ncbi:MAG: hypothetical protein Q9207_005283 [Kuettlingeria erythrocarpa]
MRCNALVLLFLSIPPLFHAGPVHSTDHNTSNLTRSEIDSNPRDLVARAEDEVEAEAEDGGCDIIETCKAAGQTLWEALQDKLKDNDAKDLEGRLEDAFHNLNLKFEKHFATHVVTGVKDEFKAYVNMFNTDQGVMNECDEEEELKLFQIAAIDNIGNKQYLKVIKEIYELRGKNKISELWEKWTYEDNQDDFITLLGTPKLSFLLRMLADHSVALRNRLPIGVWQNDRLRNAYVVIGEYKGLVGLAYQICSISKKFEQRHVGPTLL